MGTSGESAIILPTACTVFINTHESLHRQEVMSTVQEFVDGRIELLDK